MNLGLSFLRGLVAAVNPCGFVLLPTYLMYFLGMEATRDDTQQASVRRALLVGTSVTAGFMAVFVVVGGISTWFTTWIEQHAKYVTGVVGVVLIVVGVVMLFGYKLPFATPTLDVGHRDTTVRSMVVYGIAYATVSLSCTLALFIPTMFAAGEREGVAAGVVNGAAFALGMGLLVTALTVTLAVANHALLRVLRSSMRHVQTLAAAFVLLSGVYLVYYFWVVDVNEESDGITVAVENFQNRVLVSLNDNWRVAALVLGGVVVAAVAYVGLRRRSDGDPPVASPARERSTTR
ncbi:MAG: cytochrome c biogenesis protein CcdA [Ilumatobacteraceae bacterium]